LTQGKYDLVIQVLSDIITQH